MASHVNKREPQYDHDEGTKVRQNFFHYKGVWLFGVLEHCSLFQGPRYIERP